MGSMFAVLATFIATSETEVTSYINAPSSRLMIFVDLKSFKCILIIIVFSFNGNINDYLISYYFLATALTGTLFFYTSGLEINPKDYYPTEETVETGLMNNDNLKLYFDKILKTGH